MPAIPSSTLPDLDPSPVEVTDEVVRRYRDNYNLPYATADMVARHWQLERRLTEELLRSRPDERFEVFERAYTTLYQTCPWLNTDATPEGETRRFEVFAKLLGPAHKIYEVGSGKARLITFLAGRGYDCVATEITRERGDKFTSGTPNLRWSTSDGIHVDRFEAPDSYDAVISTQVIEHMHPDDTIQHFRGVKAILRRGGRYIFNTPHRLFGPADLSAVFGKRTAVCMHLKEYFYAELAAQLAEAGFTDLKAVYMPPGRALAVTPFALESAAYLAYAQRVERAADRLGHPSTKLLMLAGLTRNVFMTARKP